MKLYIMRHGQAEPRAASDAERQLTPEGRVQVAHMAQARRDDLAELTQLWVSPYVRARQTADIVRSTLGAGAPLVTELLEPEADPRALIAQLQVSDAQALLLVSHQPLVGRLLDILCGSAAGFHAMETSSLACIEADPMAAGLGQLRWLVHEREL